MSASRRVDLPPPDEPSKPTNWRGSIVALDTGDIVKARLGGYADKIGYVIAVGIEDSRTGKTGT